MLAFNQYCPIYRSLQLDSLFLNIFLHSLCSHDKHHFHKFSSRAEVSAENIVFTAKAAAMGVENQQKSEVFMNLKTMLLFCPTKIIMELFINSHFSSFLFHRPYQFLWWEVKWIIKWWFLYSHECRASEWKLSPPCPFVRLFRYSLWHRVV